MRKLLLPFIFVLTQIIPGKSQSQMVNCSNICVLDIQMDTIPGYLLVTIYNGDTNHINYPTVQVVDFSGDTIGNPDGLYYFFAQMGGDTITHSITTSLIAVPNGFTATVLVTDQVWDSTCVFSYPMNCLTGISKPLIGKSGWKIFPNPATESVKIEFDRNQDFPDQIRLYNSLGILIKEVKVQGNTVEIERNDLPPGIYMINYFQRGMIHSSKFIFE